MLSQKLVDISRLDSLHLQLPNIRIDMLLKLKTIIVNCESYEGFISGQLNPITCIYLYPAEDTTYSQ